MSTSIARLVVEMAESGASNLIGTIGKIGAAVGVAGVALGGMGLAAASANEQADISFSTMLGSAEKAQGFLSDMRDFAAKTPFEFPELQQAASSLISVGIEANDVIPIMTTLGNVTSGMGTGSEGVKRATIALQQMSAAGKISAEDLNQLRDAGIPVFDLLAGATGKTKAEIVSMAQSGKLGKTELDAMFESLKTGGAGLERFTGLMDKQSKSMAGMLATLKDTVKQQLAGAMSPAVDVVKQSLGPITDTIGSALSGLAGPLQQAFSGLAPAIGPLLSALSAIAGVVLPLVGVLGQALGPVLASIGGLVTQLQPQFREIMVTFGGLLGLVAPLVPELLNLASAFLPLISAGMFLVMSVLRPLMPVLMQVVQLIAGALIKAVNDAQPVFTQIGGALAQLMQALVPLLPVLAQLLVAFLPLLPAILQLLPPVIELATLLVGLLAPVLTGLVTLITAVVVPVINFLVTALSHPGEAIHQMAEAFDAAWEWVKNAISLAAAWIGDRITDIIGFYLSLPGRAWDAAVGLISNMAQLGSSALGALKDAILTGLTEAVGFIANLPERALVALGDLSRILWDAGRKLISGFVDGIKSAFGWVKETLGDLAGKLFSWKGPPAKDAKLLYEAGQLVMGGFIGGLESRYGDVQSSVGGVTSMIGGAGPGITTAGSGGVGGGPAEVVLQINGETFGRIVMPWIRDALIANDDQFRHVVYGV